MADALVGDCLLRWLPYVRNPVSNCARRFDALVFGFCFGSLGLLLTPGISQTKQLPLTLGRSIEAQALVIRETVRELTSCVLRESGVRGSSRRLGLLLSILRLEQPTHTSVVDVIKRYMLDRHWRTDHRSAITAKPVSESGRAIGRSDTCPHTTGERMPGVGPPGHV